MMIRMLVIVEKQRHKDVIVASYGNDIYSQKEDVKL